MRPSMWHMMADAEARLTSSWVSCEALARSGSQRHFFVDSVSRVAQKGLGRGRTGDPSAWAAVSMAWFSCSHVTWGWSRRLGIQSEYEYGISTEYQILSEY